DAVIDLDGSSTRRAGLSAHTAVEIEHASGRRGYGVRGGVACSIELQIPRLSHLDVAAGEAAVKAEDVRALHRKCAVSAEREVQVLVGSGIAKYDCLIPARRDRDVPRERERPIYGPRAAKEKIAAAIR